MRINDPMLFCEPEKQYSKKVTVEKNLQKKLCLFSITYRLYRKEDEITTLTLSYPLQPLSKMC